MIQRRYKLIILKKTQQRILLYDLPNITIAKGSLN